MKPTLVLLLLLASCVTSADWADVKKQNEDLQARFDRNQKEGWSKEERDAFRKRLEKSSKDVEDLKPDDIQRVLWLLAQVAGVIFFGEKVPAIVGLIRRRQQQPSA